MLQKKITFDSFIRGILTAVVIIGILYLVNQLSGVLLPFFVAWLIAYLIYPMVIFFQHKLRLKNRWGWMQWNYCHVIRLLLLNSVCPWPV